LQAASEAKLDRRAKIQGDPHRFSYTLLDVLGTVFLPQGTIFALYLYLSRGNLVAASFAADDRLATLL
jgi:hypothetical protein